MQIIRNWKAVPLPPNIRQLPKDERGYPIPVIIARDAKGDPLFTVNDEVERQRVINEDRCSICGNRLDKTKWLVGGPMSAFHPKGAYIDSPVHKECAEYALQVCPYMAVPSYSKSVSAKDKAKIQNAALHDPTQDARRPAVFVAIEVYGTLKSFKTMQNVILVSTLRAIRPILNAMFYVNGERIPDEVGLDLVIQEIERHEGH